MELIRKLYSYGKGKLVSVKRALGFDGGRIKSDLDIINQKLPLRRTEAQAGVAKLLSDNTANRQLRDKLEKDFVKQFNDAVESKTRFGKKQNFPYEDKITSIDNFRKNFINTPELEKDLAEGRIGIGDKLREILSNYDNVSKTLSDFELADKVKLIEDQFKNVRTLESRRNILNKASDAMLTRRMMTYGGVLGTGGLIAGGNLVRKSVNDPAEFRFEYPKMGK